MRRARIPIGLRIGLAAVLVPAALAGLAAAPGRASEGRQTWEAGEARPAAGAPPSLTRTGPYGSPLALLPRPTLAIPAIDDVTLSSEPAGAAPKAALSGPQTGAAVAALPRATGSSPNKPTGSAKSRWIEDEDDDEDDPTPAAPGTLKRDRVKVPEPSTVMGRKARRSPTSITPDYEVPLGPKASLGAYGEVGKVELERSGPIPSVRARDLTGGLTLQYRFGQ